MKKSLSGPGARHHGHLPTQPLLYSLRVASQADLFNSSGWKSLICPRLVLLRHLTCVSPQQTTEEVHEWVQHAYTFTLPKNCGLHSPELVRGDRKSSVTILDTQSVPQKNVYEGPWLEDLQVVGEVIVIQKNKTNNNL